MERLRSLSRCFVLDIWKVEWIPARETVEVKLQEQFNLLHFGLIVV